MSGQHADDEPLHWSVAVAMGFLVVLVIAGAGTAIWLAFMAAVSWMIGA